MAEATTVPHWLGTSAEPILGWLSLPPDGLHRRSGVLLVGPISYEYWTSYRSLRVLAERLATDGHLALRFDLRGMGDSSGDLWDPDRRAAWSEDIAAGVDELRRRGADVVSVVGLRLGGLLAATAAPELGVERLVAWLPVAAGRRYARELRLLSDTAPEGEATVADPDARFFAGSVLSSALLDEISALSPDAIAHACKATLVIDRREQPSAEPLVEAMRSAGGDVEYRLLDGAEQMLDVPTEYATVPTRHVEEIAGWLRPALADDLRPHDCPTVTAAVLDNDVVEEVVRLGPEQLVAIETRPVVTNPGAATVVFLNTGSEHHVGSGRVWVELARRLAARGTTAMRLDFRGWGESPDNGFAPGRPYDAHAVDDVRAVARALYERGDRTVVLVGICAGAWVALRGGASMPVAGILAFNPQLYWQPGDPVEATMTETHKRRTAERARDEKWGGRGVWSALDCVGIRNASGRWLSEIGRMPFPVDLVFEPSDDGLDYLRHRLGRRLARATRSGVLSIHETDGLDHPMHKHWHRDEAVAAIERLLRRATARPGR
jgi:alpha-beta hydrolase superfamily lysophospholipase